jgi:hypothetical protein
MATQYYFFNEETKTIYHTLIDLRDTSQFRYLGESDNPNPRMAAAIFCKGLTGCKIREYTIS